jgi:hypothetical protein
MKSKGLLIIIVLLTACCRISAQQPDAVFLPLHALAGTWKMETQKGSLYESWQKVNDSTLQSHSYKVNGKDTAWLEEVELIKRRGTIQYIPIVKGENNNSAITFTLKTINADVYTFENALHDFPQRVVYVLPQNNLLHAWIEGTFKGKAKRIDYNYTRVVVN